MMEHPVVGNFSEWVRKEFCKRLTTYLVFIFDGDFLPMFQVVDFEISIKNYEDL